MNITLWSKRSQVRVQPGVPTVDQILEDEVPALVTNNFDSSRLKILCAARFHERKGQLDLIDAFRIAKMKRRGLVLVLAGHVTSRAYAERVLEQVVRYELEDCIEVHTSLTNESIPTLMSECDIHVQPSYAEGLGLALIEAMMMGKPVIGTNVTGLDEVIEDGQDGLLVPAGDSGALATAIL